VAWKLNERQGKLGICTLDSHADDFQVHLIRQKSGGIAQFDEGLLMPLQDPESDVFCNRL
jgi:hypothetical protein